MLTDLYHLNSFKAQKQEGHTLVSVEVSINGIHPIFKGHFPGLPVLPGVCMVEIIKKIVERHSSAALTLDHAANIKFLAVLDPTAVASVSAEVQISNSTPGKIDVDAKLFSHDVVYFKMKGGFSNVSAD